MEKTMSRGPVAPKDPTKKRPFFYIMKNKEVCASPQPDGSGVVFIYESDGRLSSSAKLVGNVQDEEMLQALATTAGFRKYVHSIGVSVRKEGEPVDIGFAFQMYGKTDPYVSGTTLYMDVPSDGMELVMELEGWEWSEDDDKVGQIRFHMPEGGMTVKVSVCLYMNDGYDAPEQTPDRETDFNGEPYKKMIEKSLLNLGNTYRLKKAIDKARRGEDVTVGFIGGSITQGAGAVPINTMCYAYKAFEGFCAVAGRGTDDNVHYVKAGVGGTPSELGMLRYEADVLDDGAITPDVMIVEFAVNDEGDETKGECFDSIVRKIFNGPGSPAVILMFSVFANDWNLEERLAIVGETYNLPMVSARRAVVDQFYLKEEDGGVISKNQFFYDMFHPTNSGHRIMADGLINIFKLADANPSAEDIDISAIKAPISDAFEKVYLVDRHNIDKTEAVLEYNVGSFTTQSKELQCVERNLDVTGTPEFPHNWGYEGDEVGGFKPFSLKVKCKSLILAYMDSASIQVGCADVYVDGELKLHVDPHIVGWTHCNPLIVFRGEDSKVYNVEVRMCDGDRDKKFTILGFGIVE